MAWINLSFPGILEQFKPRIEVVDIDSTNIWDYIQLEGTAKRPKPGNVIIYGSRGANGYSAFHDFNDNHGGYTYRGAVSVAAYNLIKPGFYNEFLTVVCVPNEMDIHPEYGNYSVTAAAPFMTPIDIQTLLLATHLRYPWYDNGVSFGGPVVLGSDSITVSNESVPFFTISSGTYFDGNEHPDNGLFYYDFP